MKLLLVWCIFFLASAAFSQKQPTLYFQRITTQDGLSHNKINCILEDRRGFIWIGTDDGLNRYDGHYFEVFRHQPGNLATLSGNIVTGLLQDEQDILWITTADGGLSRYDYRLPPARQFKQFKHAPLDSTTIPVNVLNGLVQDRQGYLWLASSGEWVLRFDKKTERFDRPPQEGTRTVLSLALDGDGKIWAGRQGGGLLKIDPLSFSSQVDLRYNNSYATLPHVTITALLKDAENRMWYGSWDKVLYRYDPVSRQEEVFAGGKPYSFPNDEIDCFALDQQGRIWMGGRYFGLTIYDPRQDLFYNYRHDRSLEGTLADNRVSCIYTDRGGLVWIGTAKGLCVYDPARQQLVQTFVPGRTGDLTINDLYEDEAGRIWLACSEGLVVWNPGTDHFEHRKIIYQGEELPVSLIYKDPDGTMYIGTSYSLFVYDPHTNNYHMLPNTDRDVVMKKIINSKVVSVVRDTIDQHPVLIVSPYGHFLAYYDLVEKRWVSRADTSRNIISRFNIKDNLVKKLYKSPNGQLWLANSKAGLGSWHRQPDPHITYYENDPSSLTSLSNNNLFDLKEDGGNLWVSTYGGGLNYLNRQTGQFTHINASNNLLEGIETDQAGNVWIISNGNVDRYDAHTRAYRTLLLPDQEKTGGVHGYLYKDRAGNLYATGLNYFIRFKPDTISLHTAQPRVYLTDFSIFNSSYSQLLFQKQVELNYDQNFFTISYAAPEFAGNRIEYQFMLEGVDKEWVNAGERNFAGYSNLKAGSYAFKVRASNQKGVWNKNYTILPITIVPPFWQRWWFYGLCMLLGASALYLFYHYRINELLKRQVIRNRIAQDLHDNLGSTLSSISVYSEVAKIYQQQEKEDQLRQTLEKIGETSNDMILEMSDIVWAINPKNDTMANIIQRMESFARPLLQSKEIQFLFHYDPPVTGLFLQMETRKNFYLIFKEAINNALKYAGATCIEVSIRKHHQYLELTIKDNGAGFDVYAVQHAAPASLSGNGLQNMRMRAAEIGAVYELESRQGEGTTVLLLVVIE
ncbi:MAG: histidine kinase [Williamsia sp.]|nr:histidine kinase [Williamsia sp.]